MFKIQPKLSEAKKEKVITVMDYSAARSLREDMEASLTEEESSASKLRRTWTASAKIETAIERSEEELKKRIAFEDEE